MLNDQESYGKSIAASYERLISKEDFLGEIPTALAEVADAAGKDVVDLGAGTGRFACMLAAKARYVTATDFAPEMLMETARKLTASGRDNWKVVVADSRELPLADRSADIVISGWSICYFANANNDVWQEDLRRVMNEIRRILRPGGKIVIFETLGTGNEEISYPDNLAAYYRVLETEYGFRHRVLRTDYRFDSAEEAESLCRQFFGDTLGDQIRQESLCIVPEYTGMWWR